jgi:hypothetical protein
MLKIRRSTLLLPVLPVFFLASCATIPNGPSVMALPGTGKNFDQFREDDAFCRQYATEQVEGQTPNRAAMWSGLATALIGTGLGAVAGGAFGGASGAAIGAGGGLLAGGLMGTSTANASGNIGQQRYDIGYTQCMYAKGNHVPLSGQIMDNTQRQPQGAPTQPGYSIPPPPPGNAPSPPPSIPMS